MGCIYWDERKKNGKVIRPGTWAIRYKDVDGKQIYHRTGYKRKSKAGRGKAQSLLEKCEEEVRDAMRKGFPCVCEYREAMKPRKALLLRTLSEKYIELKREQNREPATVLRYEEILRSHVLPRFGALSPARLSWKAIQGYVAERSKEGAAPSTVRQEIIVLRGVLRLAQREGLIEANPVDLVDKPTVDNKVIRCLSVDEEARLLAVVERNSRHGILPEAIVIAINTGMREGEQLNLRWSDVNLKDRVLFIRKSKTHRQRKIPMNEAVYKAVKNLPRYDAKPTSFIFVNEATGAVYERFNGTLWKHAVKKAELTEHLRWHDLRHTFGTRLAEKGVAITDIAALMGHSSLAMAQRYIHSIMRKLRLGVATLDGYGQEGSGVDTGVDTKENARAVQA